MSTVTHSERRLQFKTWGAVREYFEALPDAHGREDARQLIIRLEGSNYPNSAAICKQVPTVDFPCGHIAVFNILGNVYRMVCVMRYQSQRMYMLRIGTHKQYDKWNLKELCREYKKP